MNVDVLIVGGGPAGGAAALGLAEAGPELAARTLLVEAAAHPRPKPCGGVISGRALEVLARLAGPLDSVPSLVIRRVLVRHGDHTRVHELPRWALAVHRPSFDAALMTSVRSAGIAVRESTRLSGLRRRPGGWLATLVGPGGSYELEPRVVLGADGVFGAVRRLSGLPRGFFRARLAHTVRPAQPQELPEDTVLFELPSRGPVAGYFWSFPAPRPTGSALRSHGVYHLWRHPTRALVDVLARRLPEGPTPTVAVQRLYQPGLPFCAEGVGLVGEALGADPLSGEGIAQAILTGARAGALLPELFNRGDLELHRWSGQVLGPEGRVMGQNALLALAAYGPGQSWVTRQVMASPVLADLSLRRFCGLPHSPAERWAFFRRLVTDGGLW